MNEALQAMLGNLMQQMDGYLNLLSKNPDDELLRDMVNKLIGEIEKIRERLLMDKLSADALRAKEMVDFARKKLIETSKKPNPLRPRFPGF